MLTKLQQKQLKKNEELIFANIDSFIDTFLDDDQSSLDIQNDAEYDIFFSGESLCLVRMWANEEGDSFFLHEFIDYKKYNEWVKRL